MPQRIQTNSNQEKYMKHIIYLVIIIICHFTTACNLKTNTNQNETLFQNVKAHVELNKNETKTFIVNSAEHSDDILADDILVKIRLNSENQNIYIYNKKKHSVDCNNDNKYEFQDVYQNVTCSYSNAEIITIKVTITKEGENSMDWFGFNIRRWIPAT